MEKSIEIFFEKLKQHCLTNEECCKQCCLRVFCYISPSDLNSALIHEVSLYLDLDMEQR